MLVIRRIMNKYIVFIPQKLQSCKTIIAYCCIVLSLVQKKAYINTYVRFNYFI